MPALTDIAHRLNGIRERIADAAGRVGRSPSDITLVAVSKTFPVEAVHVAAAAGQVHFGENKVQEGQGKILATGTLPLRWHLIGHLQTNKAKKAAALFDVIHSVDSAELLRKIDEGARDRQRAVDVLIQVDLGREATKFGVPESEVQGIIEAAMRCANARLVGLMTLPPAADTPDDARAYFTALRSLRDGWVRGGVPATMLQHLSMGMSHDFEVAVEEGATLVRVGSAIFGERSYPPQG